MLFIKYSFEIVIYNRFILYIKAKRIIVCVRKSCKANDYITFFLHLHFEHHSDLLGPRFRANLEGVNKMPNLLSYPPTSFVSKLLTTSVTRRTRNVNLPSRLLFRPILEIFGASSHCKHWWMSEFPAGSSPLDSKRPIETVGDRWRWIRGAAWPVWLIIFARGGNEGGHRRPLQPTFRDPG